MKKIILSMLVIATFIMTSCNSLDIAPLNIIKDADLFTNEIGMETYMADIYQSLPIEDFYYRNEGGFGQHWDLFNNLSGIDGEMLGPYWSCQSQGGFGYWDYSTIRNINHFIETMPGLAKGNVSDDIIKSYLGEAHFCRAFIYFALVKRYGGVPLIKDVQNYPQESITQLQVPRNKEVDCWNFIGAELDSAAEYMGPTSQIGRANRYVALAYKSRAMLYAGTIAKYGSINFVKGTAKDNGFVGIPADDANGFFQQAYDAAKVFDGGPYSLYMKEWTSDPTAQTQNYVDLFLDASSQENILVRNYSVSAGTAHSWDGCMVPPNMSSGWLTRCYPNYTIMKLFDGGNVKVVDPATGDPIRFQNRGDAFTGVEPRLRADVYFPDDQLRGYTYDIRRGIYNTFNRTAAVEVATPVNNRLGLTQASGSNIMYPPDNTMAVIGVNGVNTSPDGDNTRSGFFVRKYVDYRLSKAAAAMNMCTTPWIAMRFAEVLLNRAEAAYELGTPIMIADALNCINQLRNRAGAKLADAASFNLQTVRDERTKELLFENSHWWDLRRWRTADVVMDNTLWDALYPYYIYDEKKYIYLDEEQAYTNNYFTFSKTSYYEPLPGGELSKNPNLYPNNPGY